MDIYRYIVGDILNPIMSGGGGGGLPYPALIHMKFNLLQRFSIKVCVGTNTLIHEMVIGANGIGVASALVYIWNTDMNVQYNRNQAHYSKLFRHSHKMVRKVPNVLKYTSREFNTHE